jgi:predicted DNA-binding protein with PD1-like motif
MQVHVLRLVPGDDLRLALEGLFPKLAITYGIAAACIVSAAGSLSHAVLRYADKPGGSEISGPLELLMLSGTLSPDGAHLHGSVADSQGQVRGGHVLPGCVVHTTAEVVIALLPGWQFRRELDAATGFKELVARQERAPDNMGGGNGP